MDSQTFQESCPLGLIILTEDLIVRHAVQLYREIALRAEEVDDVTTDAVLAAEFLARELAPLQVFSEDNLGRCWRVSQLAASGFEGRNVGEV